MNTELNKDIEISLNLRKSIKPIRDIFILLIYIIYLIHKHMKLAIQLFLFFGVLTILGISYNTWYENIQFNREYSDEYLHTVYMTMPQEYFEEICLHATDENKEDYKYIAKQYILYKDYYSNRIK